MCRFAGSYLFLVLAMFVPSTMVLSWPEDKPLRFNTMSRFQSPQKQEEEQKKDNLSAADQQKKSQIDAKLKAHTAVTKRLMRVVHRGKHAPLVEFQKAIQLEDNTAPDWEYLKSQANWVEIMGIALAESPIPDGKTYLEMSKELKESISLKDSSKLKNAVELWSNSCVRCHSGWGGAPK